MSMVLLLYFIWNKYLYSLLTNVPHPLGLSMCTINSTVQSQSSVSLCPCIVASHYMFLKTAQAIQLFAQTELSIGSRR